MTTHPRPGAASIGLALAAYSLSVCVLSCRRGPSATAEADAGGGEAWTTAVSSAKIRDAAATLAPSRCTAAATGTSLGAGADSVDLGEATKTADGLAIGLIATKGMHTSAEVALLSDDLGSVKVVDVGVATGDAAPPKAFLLGGQLYVASFAAPKEAGREAGAGAPSPAGSRSMTRVLGFFRIESAEGGAATRSAFLETSLDSSFDVASHGDAALVAWDDDATAAEGEPGAALRGRVKVAVIEANRVDEPVVATPDATDADEPQLTPRPGGYWLAWIARRPEPKVDAGAPAELEGPAEERAFAWIEVIALDQGGKAVGPVRRVTSASGHVASFSMSSASVAPAQSGQGGLEIVARDDGEAIARGLERGGGRLLRVSLRTAAPDSSIDGPQVVVPESVGRATPELVGGVEAGGDGRGWLAFADSFDHTRLLPLRGGLPSLEPALEDARILGTGRGNTVWVAAFLEGHPDEGGVNESGGGAPIRAVRCGL